MADNNKIHITIYTVIGDFSRVKKALTCQFSSVSKNVGNSAIENGGEDFVIRLKDDSEIAFHVQSNKEVLGKQTVGMANFFAQVKCKNSKLHESILDQIRVFNCIIGSSFELDDNEDRSDFIVNTMFEVAKDINGIVLMPDMCLFNGDGKLLLSMEGESDFDEYTPVGNADFLDSGAEETQSDIARRERSIAVLEEKSIPYIPYLRAALMESEAKLRPPEEIARRLLAMFAVCVYCEARNGGETRDEAQKYLNKINDILNGEIDNVLTQEEKAFLAVEMPSQRALAKFGWRYECCYVLMWSLGLADDLAYPDKLCDVSGMAEIIWKQDELKNILESARPLPKEKILDAADLVLRYDWACVDARVNGRENPAGLNGEVVHEWHYAFNWLIGANGNADWDDISPDT